MLIITSLKLECNVLNKRRTQNVHFAGTSFVRLKNKHFYLEVGNMY